MRENLKQFIQNHKDLIADNKFKELYQLAMMEIPFQIGNMSTSFIDAGINPCLYVDRILPEMFSNAMLKQFDIPNNINVISREAFIDNYELTEITIPGTVEIIHSTAFKGCYKLEDIYYKGSVHDFLAATESQNPFYDCATNSVQCSDGIVMFHFDGTVEII